MYSPKLAQQLVDNSIFAAHARRAERDKPFSHVSSYTYDLTRNIKFRERKQIIRFTRLQDEVYNITRKHEFFGLSMMTAYNTISKQFDHNEAMRALVMADNILFSEAMRYTVEDEYLVLKSDELSRLAAKRIVKYRQSGYQDSFIFKQLQVFLETYDLSIDEYRVNEAKKTNQYQTLFNRICDPVWWRSNLRKKAIEKVALASRILSIVHAHGQPYACDYLINKKRLADARSKDNIEKTVLVNTSDNTEYLDLKSAVDASVSNPKNRRSELFCRLKGFENIAIENKHDAYFITLTAPSRFHSVLKNGQVNPKWIPEKKTVKDAHVHLVSVFTSIRKDLDRLKIKVYGLRVVEPHHDGTPHLHFLLFNEKKNTNIIKKIFKHHALADSPTEPGASKKRITFKKLDFEYNLDGTLKRSAVAYISKYISKNVDGQHIAHDKGTSLNGIDAAERVIAWASAHRIRQFQFFGGPNVTAWREFRRLRNEMTEDGKLKCLDLEQQYLFEKIRRSADEGDWQSFCYAMGGVFVKRKDQKALLYYDAPRYLDELSGLIVQSVNKYKEPAPKKVRGLMFASLYVLTRVKTWKLENKKEYLATQNRVMLDVSNMFNILDREKYLPRIDNDLYDFYEGFVRYNEQHISLYLDESIHGDYSDHPRQPFSDAYIEGYIERCNALEDASADSGSFHLS